jgi:hypothetical protein
MTTPGCCLTSGWSGAVMGGQLCAASALGQHALASPLRRHCAAAQPHRYAAASWLCTHGATFIARCGHTKLQ